MCVCLPFVACVHMSVCVSAGLCVRLCVSVRVCECWAEEQLCLIVITVLSQGRQAQSAVSQQGLMNELSTQRSIVLRSASSLIPAHTSR